ncbi:MAG: L-2-amino-thiazoline-4-carboxylic acid hydrolase, partial [Anaerolineae bacterium]|nr:L-2-amino-thiazoline-4-carboxylic acid hydrolase [Anaerolineae bacterium]
MRRLWKAAAALIAGLLLIVAYRLITTRRELTGANYYIARTGRLLREFDHIVARVRHVVDARYGLLATNHMVDDARREYEDLIPQIPYVGGKQPFTQFLIYTALYIALYRAMRNMGMSLEETGKLLYEASDLYINRFPRFLYSIFGRMNFSPRYIEAVQHRAEESQARKYPGDWVFEFVPGDDASFDYGIDYTECGACKFMAAQDAFELAPYLCPVDRLY